MPEQLPGAEKKITAGILALLVGFLGIHKFYLGYTRAGIIMLVVSLVAGSVTCGLAATVVGFVGLVEGIIYLTQTDAEFVATYVTGRKEWF
jgi:TM2 domain-containing membrane protein YozV